jgi:hypothetical protein
MSRTIKAIERHLTPRPKAAPAELRVAKFVAEWQQRGPETLSGLAVRKLRLAFVPTQSVMVASAAG